VGGRDSSNPGQIPMSSGADSRRALGPALLVSLAVGLLVASVALVYWTLQLPYFAGRPFYEAFPPVGAVVAAVAAARVAARGRQRADASSRLHGTATAIRVLGWLAAVIATLILLLVFAMCGFFWARTTC
jgi:hypothetical protein